MHSSLPKNHRVRIRGPTAKLAGALKKSNLPFIEPFAPDSNKLAFEAEAGVGGDEGISASRSSSTLSLWSAVCGSLASSALMDDRCVVLISF